MNSRMLIFFSVVIIIYASINFYVFIRAWQALAGNPTLRIVFAVSFWILASLFILTQLFENAIPVKLGIPLQTIGYVWLGVLIYSLLIVAFIDLLRLVNIPLHFLPQWLYAAKTKMILLGGVATIVTIILSLGYYHFRNPKLVELNIETDKPLTSDKPLRIVMFSDVHLGYVLHKGILQSYVEKINALNPDIVLCAGDLIDRTLKPVTEQKMAEQLKQIKAPLGVYAVLGNHDYIGGNVFKEIEYLTNEANIHILRDTTININNLLTIVGRDDRTNTRRKSIAELMQNADTTKPVILLDHQPYHLEESEKNGVDIYFAGHTHAGQLYPFSLLISRLYELPYGSKQKGKTHCYVSSGLGLWGPPFRIGTQSELVLLNLSSKKN